MRQYIRAAQRRFEQALIKAGILATPEEDAYFNWADSRLDDLMLESRLRTLGMKHEPCDDCGRDDGLHNLNVEH
jgi:hypothetical protein